MSIFSKAVSQVATADLQELLQENAVENSRLEFKLLVPSKDDTLKKLSSFANTFGGYMVVGAKANGDDGRIEDLPGVDEEAGYKQKVIDWCFKHVSPPLIVEVSDPIPAPATSGKVCHVIHTAESDIAPHFLNGRKGIWVRTDEFSARFKEQLANENELRHLLDRRKLIRERRVSLVERARQRVDAYAPRTRSERGIRAPFDPRLELCVAPRFPARPLCEQGNLKTLLRQTLMPWRGLTFPIPGSNTISQHESAITLGAASGDSMFEANVWGMMFYCTRIAEKEPLADTFAIHLYRFVGYTILFVTHAAKVLRALGYVGPVHLQMRLSGMREVPWIYSFAEGSPGILEQKGSVLDDDMEFSISTTSDVLYEQPDGLVVDLLSYTFFSVNWGDLIDKQSKLEDLLQMGYRYNQWSSPPRKSGL